MTGDAVTRAANKPLLTATVICKDEADKIRGCLESVRFCDEVVVVDSGSTDGTLAICRELASWIRKSGCAPDPPAPLKLPLFAAL